jgi:uncharacterized protein YceK
MATRRCLVCGLCALWLSGCATVRTLTDYRAGDPVFLSGTRLDLAAIRRDAPALRRLRAEPPAWPWLDLPLSFVADLFFWALPRTPSAPDSP